MGQEPLRIETWIVFNVEAVDGHVELGNVHRPTTRMPQDVKDEVQQRREMVSLLQMRRIVIAYFVGLGLLA